MRLRENRRIGVIHAVVQGPTISIGLVLPYFRPKSGGPLLLEPYRVFHTLLDLRATTTVIQDAYREKQRATDT
jgi:hypothetical protein